MAVRITEFFGYAPLDEASIPFSSGRLCPFVGDACIKSRHGACSIQQISAPEPVICCPNRLYAENFKILFDISENCFGKGIQLLKPSEIKPKLELGPLIGNEVAVFGRYWGQELPLPRPPGASSKGTKRYYVDWMLAKLNVDGSLEDLVAVEVQTIDTTGNYIKQSENFFKSEPFVDKIGRNPGYSSSGFNWENVNKRILPQLIYKGHVLRRESKCTKGLFFVCPKQVYDKLQERLGGSMHSYNPQPGSITFRSYELGPPVSTGNMRTIEFFGQFTTTVDQVALAFTAPMNLPAANVYEKAVKLALKL